MALIIQNQSKCPICGKTLTNEEEYVLIPPLISNINDSLFKFSDNGLHRKCLNQNKAKEKLLKHVSMFDKRLPPSRLNCIVDKLPIFEPEKLINIGLLTSNEHDELYKFNYITLNEDSVYKWQQKNDFIKVGEKYLKENKWISLTDFNYLEYIVNKIKSSC